MKRSIDYLETREEIDIENLTYYGMSWGGVMAPIVGAVEERIKNIIILGGGLWTRGRPEINQINYISRAKKPILMLHGRYDATFPLETSIKPMYDLFGTPEDQKLLKLYDTDHIAPMNEYIKEILAWLDQQNRPLNPSKN